MFAGLISKN